MLEVTEIDRSGLFACYTVACWSQSPRGGLGNCKLEPSKSCRPSLQPFVSIQNALTFIMECWHALQVCATQALFKDNRKSNLPGIFSTLVLRRRPRQRRLFQCSNSDMRTLLAVAALESPAHVPKQSDFHAGLRRRSSSLAPSRRSCH